MLMPIVVEVLGKAGLAHDEIGFVCSGSSDYLAGQAFSFVMTLDGVGPWPPISESHVDMDGAWALYEAWVKMQTGTVDTALVYSYGKSSPGDIRRVLTRQLDPYYLGPLWPDSVSLAALQARACLDAGVVHRGRDGRGGRPQPPRRGVEPLRPAHVERQPADALLAEPDVRRSAAQARLPARSPTAAPRSCSPPATGPASCASGPAWIRGIDHRIEPHSLGAPRPHHGRRRPSRPRPRPAWPTARSTWPSCTRRSRHQELILRKALGLGDDTVVNPSGGALAANPVMAAGLIRLGEAATRISAGEADRAVAHATSGPCLQQNLVCVLEGE